MTTYTTITNAEIDQDSPVTQPLMTALRDNMIAITEGASGAPLIQTAAIANDAVTAEKMATGAALAESATAVLGNIGSYALMKYTGAANLSAGSTTAGSNLIYSNVSGSAGSVPSGTWRNMGALVSNGTVQSL